MNLYRTAVAEWTTIPWRVRTGIESWVESSARERLPALYRLLHFGRLADPVAPVTFGPRHHFFGYYDKSPWNASGGLLLAHEAAFNDRPPSAADRVAVGVVHLQDGNRFEPLAETRAWNWQQGSMLQWHPADPETLLVHNDRREGRFVAVVRDATGREQGTYDRPIYAIGPDGTTAYSLNFARLHRHRPGYGYAGVDDGFEAELAPARDGIFRVDLASGRSDLIVSLAQLAGHQPRAEMAACHHWVNHIQVSPDGGRFAFFHLWRAGDVGWSVRLFSARADGSDLRCQLDSSVVSHYDWLDAGRLLVWAHVPSKGGRFILVDCDSGARQVIGEGTLVEDGHCSFSPDRRWVLNDTYPDRFDMRTLMLYRFPDGPRIDIARLHSPKARWWGEIRCDLHPRWDRSGRRVCIDSVHEGSRQMYVVDVAEFA
jgi:hypothetical protein